MLDSMSQNEIVTNLIKTKVKAYFNNKIDGSSSPKAASLSSEWNTQAYAHRTA
jgi:hypothetical protein